ncbi:MAG: hypothetical protein GEV28_40350, partial [Actinophytocola sp.]|uniref:LuxR C-terminal-related transcriptional regulator n=1 Tax=Actinophytocola sp. TaxID=1872138 RepID=UPI001327E39B
VLGELPAAERRRLHDRVARALAAAGADPLLTAAQLRAARVLTPAAARVYVRAGEQTRFTDPAAAMAWFDDAAESGAAPGEVIAGRAEAGALLGLRIDTDLPDQVPPGTAARLALLTGATATHDGRADRAAEALLAAPPPGPLLAVPVLVSTGRLAEARAVFPGWIPTRADPVPGGHDAPAGVAVPADVVLGGRVAPAEVGVPADPVSGGHDAPAGVAVPADAGSEGRAALGEAVPGGHGAVARLAEAVLVAAEDPDAAVPLLIEAAEALDRATPTAVLPDTPHAIGAVVAVLTGDLATAEHLLNRAGGGPAAAERHRMLLAWARMRAGRFPTALAELARPEGAEPPGRERLLRAAVAAGIARRRGDIAGLRAVWAGVEPALARRAVDLWQLETVEELLVAAARLHQRRRVEPVLALLERMVAGLGGAWAAALGWVRVQVAVADGDAAEVATQARRLAEVHGAGPRAAAQAEAASLWAGLLAGDSVEPEKVLAATDRLAEVELPWEASRLAGQAAIHATDPVVARRLLERARELSEPDAATTATEPPTKVGHTGGLSERELAVARLVLSGSTHKEIGAQLYIAPKTVEHHVARIRSKLGAGSRAELLATLREIIPDPG